MIGLRPPVQRWLRWIAAGLLCFKAGVALPGGISPAQADAGETSNHEWIYRSSDPQDALVRLRDALVDAMREMPQIEPGYPKPATIGSDPIPGGSGERRLRFDPATSPGPEARGILLDSRGSALQMQISEMTTARVRLWTVYLFGDPRPQTETDYFRLTQVEIGWPYLAPGSPLDTVALRRVIERGLMQAGAETRPRPAVSDPRFVR